MTERTRTARLYFVDALEERLPGVRFGSPSVTHAEPRQIILRAYEWIAGREAVRLEGRAGQSGFIKTRSFVVEPSVIRHSKRPLNERSFVVDQNLLPDRCVPV
jgi:hypothetical protein